MGDKLMKKLVLLSCLALLLSCGRRSEDSSSELTAQQSDIIVGELDWYEVGKVRLSNGQSTNTFPVGQMLIPSEDGGMFQCTGFLINEDTLMTNNHCVPDATSAKGIIIMFNYTGNPVESEFVTKYCDAIIAANPGYPRETCRLLPFACDEFVGTNKKLDYALVKCKGMPGRYLGSVTLEKDEDPKKEDMVYVIHQNCDFFSEKSCQTTKKISLGHVFASFDIFAHSADTLQGSSGSPVFSYKTNKVIGLHNMGIGSTAESKGRGSYNLGNKMTLITADIMTRFPQINLK
jgi:hypothetical protein